MGSLKAAGLTLTCTNLVFVTKYQDIKFQVQVQIR